MNKVKPAQKREPSCDGYCHNCMVGEGMVYVSEKECRCNCHKSRQSDKAVKEWEKRIAMDEFFRRQLCHISDKERKIRNMSDEELEKMI